MKNQNSYLQFNEIIRDLLQYKIVNDMNEFMQHGTMTCLDHCINVSYNSYRLCSFLKLDFKSASRGALLHDLFLYDWHTTKLPKGLHAFRHPHIALKKDRKSTRLNSSHANIS